jgi:hypothetical protein
VAQRGRMGGWDQLRSRLIGEDGRPMLYVSAACTHLIRTLPALQHDEAKPEDVDTEGEDHGPDALRYGCMSRPYVRDVQKPKVPKHAIVGEDDGTMRARVPTVREVIDRHRRKMRGD